MTVIIKNYYNININWSRWIYLSKSPCTVLVCELCVLPVRSGIRVHTVVSDGSVPYTELCCCQIDQVFFPLCEFFPPKTFAL